MLTGLDKLKPGYNQLTCTDGVYSEMLMDVGIYTAEAGQAEFFETEKESAFLILTGELEAEFCGRKEQMRRSSLFTEKPYVLHVPRNTRVLLYFNKYSEVLIQSAANDVSFKEKFYTPDDVTEAEFGKDMWNNTAHRVVRDVFNYGNAPYSNLVLGEVITMAGRWSSYIPHHHPQPEVYFYKFDHPNGFGAAFFGDEVYKITDNSVAAIPGGLTHPQVSAPGYTMYYAWMIRNLKDNPWTSRVNDEKHVWLLN